MGSIPNLSFENLKESNFVDKFKKAYEKYQRILNSDENSQDDLKLREAYVFTPVLVKKANLRNYEIGRASCRERV